MKERTKPVVNWMVAFAIAGVVLLLILFPHAFGPLTPVVQKMGYMLADPSFIMIEYATRNAINQFGGDMGMQGFNTALLLGLSSVAIIFVIAPTLILFGYKKASSDHALRPVTWHLGMGIVLIAIGYGLYASITWSSGKQNLVESADQQHALDQLQFELIDLYYSASAMAILPQERGGGSGQFTNFNTEDGSTRDIQLKDLNRYNPNSQFNFVISDVSDSTITIIGVSDFEGNDPDFQNADGSTGHIQLLVTVNPYEDSRMNIRRENEPVFASR